MFPLEKHTKTMAHLKKNQVDSKTPFKYIHLLRLVSGNISIYIFLSSEQFPGIIFETCVLLVS